MLHAFFEGAFVRKNLKRDAVASAVAPYVECKCTI
jgi:hypothetical protein